MKRKNMARNALFTSIMSLLLCVSMLVGTTFAWFTDSVTSGSNVIASGNLDIVLEYWNGGSWEDAEGKVIPFVAADGRSQDQILWEPGCTYKMAPIRVRNEGNLNAKILILLNGVTGSEKLMEAIKLKTKVSNIPESLLNGSAGNVFKKFVDAELDIFYGVPEGNVVFDHSLAGKGQVTPGTGHTDTSPEFTLFGHMAEEAGNEYQNLTLEGISITVLATQQTYESDSFDKYYDKDAEYEIPAKKVGTYQEFLAAIDEGGDIQLTSDILLNEPVTFSKPITLNLNNNTITSMGVNIAADATIENGTITSGGNTNLVPHLKVSAGTLTMNNVEVDVNHHLNANADWSEATGMEVANAKAVLNNCEISINNTTKAKWVFSYAISLSNAAITINGGSVTAECVAGTAANGPTNPNAIASIGECTATLNDVTVTAMYYGTTVNGHLTINTTDNSITSANVVDNRGGSHTLNYISN